MRKIKVISTSSGDYIQSSIDEWLEEAGDINIISVNGTMDADSDNVTYILYEERKSETDILNS
jgi:hypothetical protein